MLFVTVSVQCFCPLFCSSPLSAAYFCQMLSVCQCFCHLFSLFWCPFHISAVCCLLLCLSTVSAICFHFASVCSMFLPFVVCYQCLSSVSIICFLFTGVCSMFLQCVSVTVCAQVSALCFFLLPVSTQCFCHIVIFSSVLCSLLKKKLKIACFCAPPDFFLSFPGQIKTARKLRSDCCNFRCAPSDKATSTLDL